MRHIVLLWVLLTVSVNYVIGSLTAPYIGQICKYTGTVHGLGTLQHECHTSVPKYLKETSQGSVILTKWRPWTKQTQINGFLCQSIRMAVTCTTSLLGSRDITEIPYEVYLSSEECDKAPVRLEKTQSTPVCKWWDTVTVTEVHIVKRPIWGTLLSNGTVFFPEIGVSIPLSPNYYFLGSLIAIWSSPSHEYHDYSCHYVPIGSVKCTKTVGVTEDKKHLTRYNCSNDFITFLASSSQSMNCRKGSNGELIGVYLSTSGEYVSESNSSIRKLNLTIGADMLQDEINKLRQELFSIKYMNLCSHRNTLIRTLTPPSILSFSEMKILYGLETSVGLYSEKGVKMFGCFPTSLLNYTQEFVSQGKTYCFNHTLGVFVPSMNFVCSINKPVLLQNGSLLHPNNTVEITPLDRHNRFYIYPETELTPTRENPNLLPSSHSIEGYHSVIYRNPILTGLIQELTLSDLVKSVINILIWLFGIYVLFKVLKVCTRSFRKMPPKRSASPGDFLSSRRLMSVED